MQPQGGVAAESGPRRPGIDRRHRMVTSSEVTYPTHDPLADFPRHTKFRLRDRHLATAAEVAEVEAAVVLDYLVAVGIDHQLKVGARLSLCRIDRDPHNRQ